MGSKSLGVPGVFSETARDLALLTWTLVLTHSCFDYSDILNPLPLFWVHPRRIRICQFCSKCQISYRRYSIFFFLIEKKPIAGSRMTEKVNAKAFPTSLAQPESGTSSLFKRFVL